MTSRSLPVIPSWMPTHDNTMMDDLDFCERLYALKHVAHRRMPGRGVAVSFGSLMHLGLDAFYKKLPRLLADRNSDTLIEAAEAAVQVLQEAPYEDPYDDHRTRQRAIKVLIDYIAHYGVDVDFTKIVFTETAHDIRHRFDDFPWGGVIDLWVDSEGEDWIVDHKTTSVFGNGDHYYAGFRRSPQMMGYVLDGAELTGRWPAGVWLNVLIIHKDKHFFDRKKIPFPHWLIEEFKRMQWLNYLKLEPKLLHMQNTQTFEADIWNDTVWKPNLYNCGGKKYGPCEMYNVCHSIPENRIWIMNNELEEFTWDWRTARE